MVRPAPTKQRQPQQRRAQNTIDKVLDASAQLLAERGYEGLNTNAVAKIAGVNISTLYRYFPNKEALLESLLQKFHEQQMEMVEEKLSANSDRDNRVGQIVDALISMMIENPWMLALKDAMNVSPQLRELRNGSQQATIAAITSRVPNNQAPRVSGKKQKAVLRLLLDLFNNGVQLAVNTPEAERKEIVEEVKIMLNSYLDNYRYE
jgi:AcrR family transcriptional regulator